MMVKVRAINLYYMKRYRYYKTSLKLLTSGKACFEG